MRSAITPSRLERLGYRPTSSFCLLGETGAQRIEIARIGAMTFLGFFGNTPKATPIPCPRRVPHKWTTHCLVPRVCRAIRCFPDWGTVFASDPFPCRPRDNRPRVFFQGASRNAVSNSALIPKRMLSPDSHGRIPGAGNPGRAGPSTERFPSDCPRLFRRCADPCAQPPGDRFHCEKCGVVRNDRASTGPRTLLRCLAAHGARRCSRSKPTGEVAAISRQGSRAKTLCWPRGMNEGRTANARIWAYADISGPEN